MNFELDLSAINLTICSKALMFIIICSGVKANRVYRAVVWLVAAVSVILHYYYVILLYSLVGTVLAY